MPLTITVRAAELPKQIDQLRAFAAARGREPANALERHLARPRYRPALTRVAARAGELVGYALIGHQRLRLGVATLETGVIEPFVVREPEDSELFAALLGDCLGALLDQGLPFVRLAGANAQHAPFGFAPYHFESAVELRSPAAGARLRAAVNADLDDLSALYQASYDGLALTDDRAPADWRAWAEQHAALALEDSRGRLVGYAALAATQSLAALAIDEAAAADAGAARSLCAGLLERAREQGRSALLLRLSPWHMVAQAALHLGGTARLGTADAADVPAMAGVVDLPGALEALAPEFERRLARSRYAGWSGNLRIEIETERVTLAFERGIATVIDGSRPPDLRLRQVTLPALAQLCLGYRAAADLRATSGLACDDSALGLIDALFPTVFATA